MILEKLAGQDRRSIGLADEVAEEIAHDQGLFDRVFGAMWSGDPVLRMRAADAVEKASRRCPERLFPHRDPLLDALPGIEQHEVRWHVAQMLPRLPLDESARRRAFAIVERWLADKSTIVRVNALQALADLARGHAELEAKVQDCLTKTLRAGTAAEKARARKLLGLRKGKAPRP